MSSDSNDDDDKVVAIKLSGMPKKKLKEPRGRRFMTRVEKTFKIAGDTASMLASIPNGKPSPLAWVGIVVRIVSLFFSARREFRSWKRGYAIYAFDRSRWEPVPKEFQKSIVELATEPTIVGEFWNGSDDSEVPVVADLGGEVVGWVLPDIKASIPSEGPFLLKERKEASLVAMGERMWLREGFDRLLFTPLGFKVDQTMVQEELPQTQRFIEIEERLAPFLQKKIGRNVLFAGPPGTGKSIGVVGIARRFSRRSVRVDLSTFLKGDGLDVVALCVILRAMKPDAVVFDDLDRVGENIQLLDALEQLARSIPLVLATANYTGSLIQALLRPGRFDEVITIDSLDAETVQRIVACPPDLAVRLTKLPVAYVAEYAKRMKVLGEVNSELELEELERRAARVSTVYVEAPVASVDDGKSTQQAEGSVPL